MDVGYSTSHRGGINATDIPVGAIVRYDGFSGPNGAMPPNWTMEVMMREGKKVLAFPGTTFGDKRCPDQFIHGQNGLMTVLSLP